MLGSGEARATPGATGMFRDAPTRRFGISLFSRPTTPDSIVKITRKIEVRGIYAETACRSHHIRTKALPAAAAKTRDAMMLQHPGASSSPSTELLG